MNSSGDDQQQDLADILAGASRNLPQQATGKHMLERGCRIFGSSSGEGSSSSTTTTVMTGLISRYQLRQSVQFTQPLGVYFLTQAKAMWMAATPTAMPFLPNHDCMIKGASCSRVQVRMCVFIRDPPTEQNVRDAHVCLKVAQRHYLCDRPSDQALHRRELAVIDHNDLYFCNFTGRLHICGQGMCALARHNTQRDDDYQAVCPITGFVPDMGATGVVVGSEFWKAGEEVGSRSDNSSSVTASQYSVSADDLTRLMAMHAPPQPHELLQQKQKQTVKHHHHHHPKQQPSIPVITATSAAGDQVVPSAASRKKSGKGKELERFIAARNETGFVHRKKLESPLWLEWMQKFAEWDMWLDTLMSMTTFQQIAAHLKDILQESYRRVWKLDGLVRRYATALVYAAFCPERYINERRIMADEVTHSVRRLASSTSAADPNKPVIFSQLVDATMGALTRTRHGNAYTDASAVVATAPTLDGKSRGTVVVLEEGQGPPRAGEQNELRARVTHYAQRVLHLWAIVNELFFAPPDHPAVLECFPLAHFVFAALDCFADGMSVSLDYSQSGGSETYRWDIIHEDNDMRRCLPKEWECIGANLYDHSYSKMCHNNCLYLLTTAIQTGRIPRDYLVTYKREWSDLKIDQAQWLCQSPNKAIFRAPPKKLQLDLSHLRPSSS